MTQPAYTHITFVLDRSGSMQSIVSDTIGGFNRFLEEQQQAPGRATMTLVQFDHEYEPLLVVAPLSEARPLSPRTYRPRGSTALLDAIGRAIDETGQSLAAMNEPDRPSTVLFVILTDGQENASRVFTRERVFDMISHQRAQYQWQFVFLGANQDAIAEASHLGIAAGAALTFAPVPGAAFDAFQAVSRACVEVRTKKRKTHETELFTPDERRRQAEAVTKTRP